MYIPFKVLEKKGAVFIGVGREDSIDVNMVCFGKADGCYGFRSDGSKAQYGRREEKFLAEKWDIDEKLWLKVDFTNDAVSFNIGKNWKAGMKADAFKNVDLKSGAFKILIALQGKGDSVKIMNADIKYEDIKERPVSINQLGTPAAAGSQGCEPMKSAELAKLAEEKK